MNENPLSEEAIEVAAEVKQVSVAALAVVADSDAAVRSYLMSLKSPRSVSTATESLKRITVALELEHHSQIPWSKLGLEELTAIKNRLSKRGTWGPATVNLTLSTVRQVLDFIAMKTRPAHEIARALGGVRGTRVSKGRELSSDEILKLLEAARAYKEPKASMIVAILMLSLGTGLRRAEICTLPIACKGEDGLRVRGKGDKDRVCPLDDPTRESLESWLVVRRKLYSDTRERLVGAPWAHRMLFGSPIQGKPLSAQVLWQMLKDLAIEAHVNKFSPHDLRRTFASKMLAGRVDLSSLKDLMGHTNVETTVRYDKRSAKSLAELRNTVRVYVPPEPEEFTMSEQLLKEAEKVSKSR